MIWFWILYNIVFFVNYFLLRSILRSNKDGWTLGAKIVVILVNLMPIINFLVLIAIIISFLADLYDEGYFNKPQSW